MKPAAVTKKPTIDTDAALRFASHESPQAIKTASARGRAGPAAREAQKAIKAVSGLVPDGDVRLTANIRRDLHKRLKDAAAQRQYETGKGFTIGELIEELIEAHVPEV